MLFTENKSSRIHPVEYRDLPDIVQEVGRLKLYPGVPRSWYAAISRKGKSDAAAISVLWHVVSTCYPNEIEGGLYQQYFDLFRLDLSYNYISELLSMTKNQVKRSAKFLESLGLVCVINENRIDLGEGIVLGSTAMVFPEAKAIAKITEYGEDEIFFYQAFSKQRLASPVEADKVA